MMSGLERSLVQGKDFWDESLIIEVAFAIKV